MRSSVEQWRPSRLLKRVRGIPDVDLLVARGLQIGRNVYIGRGSVLDSGFPWLISIGDDSTLSAGVRVIVHDASTKKPTGYTALKPVSIGSRVYIGAGSIVLPGVTIGDDAIVGAGSVVSRDVAPGTVVAGNPARQLKETTAHVEQHLTLINDGAPKYPLEGFTLRGGVTEENMRRMLEELRAGAGIGYIR